MGRVQRVPASNRETHRRPALRLFGPRVLKHEDRVEGAPSRTRWDYVCRPVVAAEIVLLALALALALTASRGWLGPVGLVLWRSVVAFLSFGGVAWDAVLEHVLAALGR